MALSRLLGAALSLWTQFAVPLLFSVFWLVLFAVYLCSSVMSPAASSGLLFFLLTGWGSAHSVCVCVSVHEFVQMKILNSIQHSSSIPRCLCLCVRVRSVSECCATPYSLLGLTFVVSYLALGLLNLCKLFLGSDDAALHNHNVMHR